MVVLDEHAVGKVKAVVGAAADAHGILFENAKTGCGLARIGDFGVRSGNLGDRRVGARGNAGQTLHEVERGAFAGEDILGVGPKRWR